MAGDLFEREREIAACAGALSDGRSGRGGLVLIEGAAGTGKTRLLARAIGQAREAGMRVLSARAAVSERAFGFGVVRQLLGPVLAGADAATRARLLAGAAVLALPALELGADAGEGTLHGLFWLLANLAGESPLAIAVDDLHWADDASRALLAFAARRVDGLPADAAAGRATTRAGCAGRRPGRAGGRAVRPPARARHALAGGGRRGRRRPPRPA